MDRISRRCLVRSVGLNRHLIFKKGLNVKLTQACNVNMVNSHSHSARAASSHSRVLAPALMNTGRQAIRTHPASTNARQLHFNDFSAGRPQFGLHDPNVMSWSPFNFKSPAVAKKEFAAFKQMLLRSSSPFKSSVASFSTSSRHFQRSPFDNQHDSNQNKDGKKPENDDQMPMTSLVSLVLSLGVMLIIMYFLQSSLDSYRHISWNTFENDMLLKGEVSKVIIIPYRETVCVFLQPGAIVNGRKAANPGNFYYSLKVSDINKVEEKIRHLEKGMGIPLGEGTSITYERRSDPVAMGLIFLVMLGLIFVLKSLSTSISTFYPTNMFRSQRKAKYVRVDKIAQQGRGITFKDVVGLHEAKVEIMEFLDYLKRPEKFKSIGARIPKGALLLGPPGCGKTLLAKAVANEAQVPFLAMAGSDFVEMIGGLGASRVRDLFKDARENSPCIVYIDEIDAIGRSRGGQNVAQGSGESEQTLNQLLVEMDGMGSTEGVIMLASTNRADILDNALLRPGRFDRHILIDLPTLQERRETFELYLKKLKTASPAIDYVENLAQLSPGMSGADIANICNESALYAARHKKKAIDVSDFDYAVERVIAGVAKKSTVLSQKEKKILAYHEAGHALVGWLLEHTDVLLKVTIVPRTSKALGFAQYMPKENGLYSKDELFDKMCMAIGGRVAESLTFNSISQVAQEDLSRITKMAYLQIRELGMNAKVGPVSYGVENEDYEKPYSKYLAQVIDEEARILIAKSYKVTEKILKANQEKLRVISDALLEKECLSYRDMEELIGPPPFGKKSPLTSEWDEKTKSD